MRPRNAESLDELRPRAIGAARVLVAGATSASGTARIAAMLGDALLLAGLENGSIEIVNAGSMLDGVEAAAAEGAWRFVVVTGIAAKTLAAAFAMVKAIESRHPGAPIELLVTAQDASRAHAAYLRVRSAAERFLGRAVSFAGVFAEMDTAPADESEDADSTRRRATRASRAARMWAARLLAECSEGAWPETTHSMN